MVRRAKGDGNGTLTLSVKGQQMDFDLDALTRIEAVDNCPR